MSFFHLNSVFFAEIGKKWRNYQYLMNIVFFRKKNSSFQKLFLAELEGGNYADGGRRYCCFSAIFIIWMEKHPLKAVRFFMFTCQMSGKMPRFWIWSFLWNATQIVRFLKYLRNLFSFKRHLLQNWRAENLPMVAGRLVLQPLKYLTKFCKVNANMLNLTTSGEIVFHT